MIGLNCPVLRVQHFKAKPHRARSVILSFSKHTYITATVPVTVIRENFWDSHHKKDFMCELCSNFSAKTYKWQSKISPLCKEMPPLYRTVNLSQHNELPDREVAELHHSKTGLFAVTATENSHHSSVLVMWRSRHYISWCSIKVTD